MVVTKPVKINSWKDSGSITSEPDFTAVSNFDLQKEAMMEYCTTNLTTSLPLRKSYLQRPYDWLILSAVLTTRLLALYALLLIIVRQVNEDTRAMEFLLGID